MKSTGIVRRLDALGRLCLPKELRRTMQLTDNAPVKFFIGSTGEVILKKYNPGCVFCGEETDGIHFKRQFICFGCLNERNHALAGR